MRRQVKQLAAQLDGVRAAEDIEFVHRARVATRRLRSALRMFEGCFRHKKARRWRTAIRRTTIQLGDARDRDVQIEWLCSTLATLTAKECFPGISHILVLLEREREQLQRKVVKAVDRIEAQGVLRDIRRTTTRILLDTNLESDMVATPVACARTGKHIRRQLDALLQYQGSLGDPNDREQHHAMRIAVKRLRYTLEIARPVCPGQLDEALDAAKTVQSLLGDIHDCDVWLEDLDAFADSERQRIAAMFGHAGRFSHLEPGIDYLRQDRQSHRQATFARLVEFWADLGRRQLWERLVRLAASHKLPADHEPDSNEAAASPEACPPATENGEPQPLVNTNA